MKMKNEEEKQTTGRIVYDYHFHINESSITVKKNFKNTYSI